MRSYVNDLPDRPLVAVSVTGAVNVACFTIEEKIPNPASVQAVSNGGVWLPSLGVIRWGPFFHTVATNVTYRLTGLPASYPISGGVWMDGQWYFSPGVTLVPVLPAAGVAAIPSSPQQLPPPLFMPSSGSPVPVDVLIGYIPAATNGAAVPTNTAIYYTLDGSVPTQGSTLYTGAFHLTSANVVRAAAFASDWIPSVASVAYYGPVLAPANMQITHSIDTNTATFPTVTLSVTPGTNASCFALTEILPPEIGASNVSAGGSYLANSNVVLWGPFFGTGTQTLSYQAVGQPGDYLVRATWSLDGVSGGEPTDTSLVIASTVSNSIPAPSPEVATPTFNPAGGSNIPVNVTIADGTPGAIIYYTLDGSLPTQNSTLYTGAVYLACGGVVRARAFKDGWTPSVASVACFAPRAAPADVQVTRSVGTNSSIAPVVTLTVSPGANATCVAVTESLSPGLAATAVTSGGTYIPSNNVVLWGPFFGTNAQVLSYQPVGLPGSYPVQAAWSVDGVSGGESVEGSVLIAAGSGSGPALPIPPQQEPIPILTPSIASNLPVIVSMSSIDPLAQLYFTTDGSLPMQNSTPYTGPIAVTNQTSVRARAFRAGYSPSLAALGEYVPRQTTNSVLLVRSVSGSGTFLASVTLTAAPQGAVNCYSVTETIPFGLTPSGLGEDASWNPFDGTIRWGPYLDDRQRTLSYNLVGPSGNYPLTGQGSFDGYPVAVTGANSVSLNANYSGAEPVNIPACAVQHLTYFINIDPAPDRIMVTSANGTVDWGDGTQSAITQPVMVLEKAYTAPGTYAVNVSADWFGYRAEQAMSGHATKTDTFQIVTNCVPPSIVTQPSDEAVFAGATAQFRVSATSQVPMTYQWYLNETKPVFSPSALSTLTLPNAVAESAGLYSVVVANVFGSTTSSVATLTVVAPLITGAIGNTNGSVTLRFATLPNSAARLWATTNLTPPVVWLPLATNDSVGTNGVWEFTNTNAASLPAQFYRFSTP